MVNRQLEQKRRGVLATDYEIDVVSADGRRRRVEVSSVRIESGDRCHAIFGVALPRGQRRTPSVDAPMLTPRQAEVLRLLAEGASTAQMAERLHLSRETVRNHVRHVLRALHVHSRVEAVAVAYREGLL
jgi:DNA-binding CsgD family transcriptional regulator